MDHPGFPKSFRLFKFVGGIIFRKFGNHVFQPHPEGDFFLLGLTRKSQGFFHSRFHPSTKRTTG
jgi:hypothetical protein